MYNLEAIIERFDQWEPQLSVERISLKKHPLNVLQIFLFSSDTGTNSGSSVKGSTQFRMMMNI